MTTDFKSIATISNGRKRPSNKIVLIDHSGDDGSIEAVEHPDHKSKLCFKSCRVTEPQLNGSFAYGGFVTYLCTIELGSGALHLIRKRYSDFLVLRAKVRAHFPDVYLPTLPAKSYTKKTEGRFIESRRNGIELFLKGVVLNPETSELPYLQEWLGCNSLSVEG